MPPANTLDNEPGSRKVELAAGASPRRGLSVDDPEDLFALAEAVQERLVYLRLPTGRIDR
jgi:hypothetical protein